jgi:hypothetical protein
MLGVPRYRAGNMHIGIIKVICVYADSYRIASALHRIHTLSLIKLLANNHLEKKIYLISEVL